MHSSKDEHRSSVEGEKQAPSLGEVLLRYGPAVIGLMSITLLLTVGGSLPRRQLAAVLGIAGWAVLVAYWWVAARFRLAKAARRVGDAVIIGGGVSGERLRHLGWNTDSSSFEEHTRGYLMVNVHSGELWALAKDTGEPERLSLGSGQRVHFTYWIGRVWSISIKSSEMEARFRAFGRFRGPVAGDRT